MTENEFSMVSEWMPNGNINRFVKSYQDANRFELVSFPSNILLSLSVIDNWVALAVERRCEGLDLHARSRDDSWGS